jgi:DHA1 family multidrug resistance protein-like MFS transporter
MMVWSISILYALELGADVFQVNLITTIRSITRIIFLVPFGILSDRYGRKPMILGSRIFGFFGTLIRAFATDPNHIIIASFVGGFAGGGLYPILLSMIGDVAKPKEQQEAISTLYLFSSVGMIIGPIISTFLLTTSTISLRNIYQIVVIAQALILLYLALMTRETKPKIPKSVNVSYGISIKNLIFQTNFQSLFIMAFLYFFSRSIITTYIPIIAQVNLTLTNAEIASFATYQSLAVLLIRLSSATFLTKVSIKRYLIASLTIGGIICFAVAFANNYLSLMLIMFFSGISYGAIAILGNTLIARNSSSDNRGVANSLYNFAQSTAPIMLLFATPLIDLYGFTPIFLIGGIIGLISVVPTFFQKTED